jgi:diguanylate cyclase (GGDEF)-like protein
MSSRQSFNNSVARRMIVLFMLCALLPVAAAMLLSYNRVRDTLAAERFMTLAQAATSYATSLIDKLTVAGHLARTVVSTLDAERISREPHDFEQHFRRGVIYEAGGARAVFGPAAGLPDYRHIAPVGGAEAALLLIQDPGASPSVWLVLDTGAAARGASKLALEVNPDYLWGADDELPYLTSVCVIDAGASPLHCTGDAASAALVAYREHSPDGAVGQLAWEAEGARYLGAHREVFLRGKFGEASWSVVVSQPAVHALAPMRAVSEVVVPVVVVGLLLAALLGLVQVRRTLGPLKALTEATRRIAEQDFDARVPATRNDEFGALAHAFNAMSGRLGRQFKALEGQAEIDAVVLSNVDLSRVVAIALRRVTELAPADHHFLMLAEAGSSDTYRLYSHNAGDGLDGRMLSLASDEAERLRVAANGISARTVEAFAGIPGSTVFALPVALGAELAGALVLSSDDGRAPDAETTRLLRDLADRVAVAIGTARRDSELYRRAHYDPLTQLPNRLLGKDELDRAVAMAARQRRPLAVLFVDLDGFSTVNDSLSHAAGDELLVRTAVQLRGALRKADIVARLGGDEFAVVLTEIREPADAALVARNIITKLSEPFEYAGRSAFVSASVGIALFPGDGKEADELLRHADLAMYTAKHAGRGQTAFFEASMTADAGRRFELARELREALTGAQFELHYQPQLDLRSGRIVGAEALIRWRHPKRGLVPPLQFIGFAESNGLIEDIGCWALQAATSQYAAWRAAGIAIEHVSVNVSPRQLRQDGFPGVVEDALRSADIPPQALRLEITESAVIDPQGCATANLAALHALGTPLELDDFGTGYSSLAHLQQLPVATVKLDRAFLKAIESSPSSQTVVRAAIDMAHALGKSVVAEGVEQAGQVTLLAKMGCDFLQGYHVSKPLEAPKFAQFKHDWEAQRKAAARP